MPVAILWSEGLKEYDFGPGHPFRGDRFEVFMPFLKERVPEGEYRVLGAEAVTDADLLLVCEREYIEFVSAYYRAAHRGLSIPSDLRAWRFLSADNIPRGRPGRLEEAARLLVGQAKMACDLVQRGEYQKAFCIGSGMHHAKPNYGEGFCIYNDVAFAARYLMERYGLEKILILDTDAHGGNGTMEYFYEDPKVLFLDIHQDPYTLYPGTGFVHQIGRGEGEGFTVNIPMPPVAGDESYEIVFEEVVGPLTEEFRPQVIIRNGGSDPHFADGLTRLGLTVAGLRMVGERVGGLSGLYGGRVIDMVGSGYNRRVLPYGWLALISGVAGWGLKVEEPESVPPSLRQRDPIAETRRVVREVKDRLSPYWKCLRG